MSPCPRCGAVVSTDRLLAAVTAYSTDTDSGLSACPRCGGTLDFRVGAGKLELGYTYWAGSMHFEAITSVPIAGLRVIKAGSALAFSLGDTVYPVPAAEAIRRMPQGDSP